ncbi:MAG: hypothetical protein FJW37_06575, partial [Acidobacteria bacterium]|nr:hypothetical protein [Acidobacteriota bacterium]
MKIARYAFALALGAGLVSAQGQGPAPGSGRDPQQFRQHWLDRMARLLALNESQKTQAKSIFDAAHQSAQPLQEQLRLGSQALRDAVKTSKSSAEIDQLAAAQGARSGQLLAIHT